MEGASFFLLLGVLNLLKKVAFYVTIIIRSNQKARRLVLSPVERG